jgi:flagellar biogenesis protein FliO
MNPNTQPTQQGSGAFIGSLIIVLALVGLAIYFIHDEQAQRQAGVVQAQKIREENAANAAILESIEAQLGTPEPDYINNK